MGAYLSEPNLNKESLDDCDEKIAYGASSMQGWRLEQEDAHNAILDFDSKTSFFAVYDGHGGQEVAAYCAKYLPNFLKSLEEYKNDEIEEALKKLFLKFDESLLTEMALKELASIRDTVSGEASLADEDAAEDIKSESAETNEESSESDNAEVDEAAQKSTAAKPDSTTDNCDNIDSEAAALYDEACMPIEEVLKRYNNTEKKMNKALKKKHLKNANSAHLSPMIKPKNRKPPPAKSAAELDQQEEIDITEIKKNGNVELNGSETNCELDFDEASNLGDVTDSQKDADADLSESKPSTDSAQVESSTSNTVAAESCEVDSTKPELATPKRESRKVDTPNTKQRLKLRQEEIKLSPIRNKSLSSSSLCEEAASSQKDETVTSIEEDEAAMAKNNESADMASPSKTSAAQINEENKENDIYNGNGEQVKGKDSDEKSEDAVTTTTKSSKEKKKDQNNLIAKLIAGVINKRLRSGQTSKQKENDKAPQGDDKDDDDDFDADYTGSEDEDSEEEDSEDVEDDEEDDESEDDDNYEDDDDDDDEEEESGENDDYPVGTGISKPGFDSGCTAVVAVLCENKKLYVANAGDSRCVVCRDGKAIDMSYDHKPEDDIERERVEKAGGQVTSDGRINNGLNLSRAIGDHTYKRNKDLPLAEQMITSLPDVMTLDIDPVKDKFMVLACDGIWNFMSSQDVCEYIQERIDAGYAKLSQVCEELFLHCLAPNTEGDGTGCDNMTCILVTFHPFQKVEIKLNKNSLVNVESIEQDKNGLKRTCETSGSETNLTKKPKQEVSADTKVAN